MFRCVTVPDLLLGEVKVLDLSVLGDEWHLQPAMRTAPRVCRVRHLHRQQVVVHCGRRRGREEIRTLQLTVMLYNPSNIFINAADDYLLLRCVCSGINLLLLLTRHKQIPVLTAVVWPRPRGEVKLHLRQVVAPPSVCVQAHPGTKVAVLATPHTPSLQTHTTTH